MSARTRKHIKPNTNPKQNKKHKSLTAGTRAKMFVYLIVILVTGFWLVHRYNIMYEMSDELERLKVAHKRIENENKRLRLEIDSIIDLEYVENTALTRFGMKRPDRSQLIYIDMNVNDRGEKIDRNTEKISANDVIINGVPGVLLRAIKTLR